MAQPRIDRWHNDFVFGCLGVALGSIVVFVIAPHIVDSLSKLAMGTWLVVAGTSFAAWMGGHFSGFPLRRFVQLAAGFIMSVALTGIFISTM